MDLAQNRGVGSLFSSPGKSAAIWGWETTGEARRGFYSQKKKWMDTKFPPDIPIKCMPGKTWNKFDSNPNKNKEFKPHKQHP